MVYEPTKLARVEPSPTTVRSSQCDIVGGGIVVSVFFARTPQEVLGRAQVVSKHRG